MRPGSSDYRRGGLFVGGGSVNGKLTWFKQNAGEWRRITVHLSLEEKGFYQELRILLHDATDERGVGIIDGKVLSDNDVAELIDGTKQTKQKRSKTLAKLEAKGGIKREAKSGAIIDPQFTGEEAKHKERQRLSEMRAEAGRKGGLVSGSKRRAKSKAKSKHRRKTIDYKGRVNIYKLRSDLVEEATENGRPVEAVKKAAYEVLRDQNDIPQEKKRHVFNRRYTDQIKALLPRLPAEEMIDDLLGMVGRDITFPLDYCLQRNDDFDAAPKWEMMARRKEHEQTKSSEIGDPIREMMEDDEDGS